MRIEQIPVVGPLLAAGADDRIFDALLVMGPVIIVTISLLGRGPVSIALAAGYIVWFVGYVGYKAARGDADGNT